MPNPKAIDFKPQLPLDDVFQETYFDEKWQNFQSEQKKTTVSFKIYVFFGMPVPEGDSTFKSFIGAPQSTLAYLLTPFVFLFNVLRVILLTSLNLVKLLTEFGPSYLNNLAERNYRRALGSNRSHFLPTLLYRLTAGIYLLGLSATSPIKAMQNLSKRGGELGKGHGKFAETSLWFLFGFLSLAVTTSIYTFILPFALQAIILQFPVAAASAASFFATNFPNLVTISIAASPVILAGVEVFGAMVLAMMLFTDMATSLVQKFISYRKDKRSNLGSAVESPSQSQGQPELSLSSSLKPAQAKNKNNKRLPERLEDDEYLLVEGGSETDWEIEEDLLSKGSSQSLYRKPTAPDVSITKSIEPESIESPRYR